VDQTRGPGLRVSVLRGLEVYRDEQPVEIPGHRLRSLLALLALTPGSPRRPEYLADQLWDGEPPSANALQALISRLRRVLGPDAVLSRPNGYLLAAAPEHVDLVRFDRLIAEGNPAAAREALALAGPEPLAEFAEVPDLADEAHRVEAACWKARPLAEAAPPRPAPSAAPASAHRAAPGGVRLIGRERLLAEITERLATTRLLTLVGAGGAGKTSLAKAVAYARDGAVVAELAPVGADAVLGEVLTAVGGRELVLTDRARRVADLRDDRTRIAATLANRKMLLVLDNCEHVVDAAADLAAMILDRCPQVTILTTSREPLAVPGEVRLPVDPLPVPPVEAEQSRLGDYAAMQLLLERGRAVRPDLATDGADGDALAEICRRLDGSPLALELAAARFSLLTPRQVADRLDDRFRLLTNGARTALPRQQTLRAVVDWSWDLLDPQEREVLATCSVFYGGAVLEDLDAVAGADVLDVLGRLVAKSLVVADRLDDGAMRYRLLETIREYARDRLVESGCEPEVRDRHAAHYLELAAAAESELRRADQLDWLYRLDAEDDNMRAALTWALEREDAKTALRLCMCLSWYWMLRGRRDIQPLYEGVITLGDREGETGSLAYATCVALHGITALDAGQQVEKTKLALVKADGIFRELDEYSMVASLVRVVLAMLNADSFVETLDAVQAEAEARGRDWDVALLLMFRSRVASDEDTAEAERCARRAIELFRAHGDRWGGSEAGQALGYVLSLRGDHRAALAAYNDAAAKARELQSVGDLAMLSVQAAWELEFLGQRAEADRRLVVAEQELTGRPASAELHTFMCVTRADFARRRGDLAAAEHWVNQGRMQSDAGFLGPFRPAVEICSGYILIQQDRPGDAVAHFVEGLAAATRFFYDRPDVAACVEGLAAAAVGLGRPWAAAELLGAAAAIRPLTPPRERYRDGERTHALVHSALAPEDFDRAFEEGRALTPDAVLTVARRHADALTAA
jgi:predicted ATPase/DNA-binding winged helix-turn-helix (wHTH) protein